MKRNLTLFILSLLALSGCHPPPSHYVNFFESDGYIKPYETEINQKITFVFDPGVQDAFMVSGSGSKKMPVNHFRKSLTFSLYYTFINSFKEVNFSDQPDQEGISVVLYRIRPVWEVKSSSSSIVSVNGNVTTSTYYNIISLIRYDGIIYKDGVKALALDNAVMSEKSTFSSSKPDVFRDGVSVLCSDIYKEVLKAEPIGYR